MAPKCSRDSKWSRKLWRHLRTLLQIVYIYVYMYKHDIQKQGHPPVKTLIGRTRETSRRQSMNRPNLISPIQLAIAPCSVPDQRMIVSIMSGYPHNQPFQQDWHGNRSTPISPSRLVWFLKIHSKKPASLECGQLYWSEISPADSHTTKWFYEDRCNRTADPLECKSSSIVYVFYRIIRGGVLTKPSGKRTRYSCGRFSPGIPVSLHYKSSNIHLEPSRVTFTAIQDLAHSFILYSRFCSPTIWRKVAKQIPWTNHTCRYRIVWHW
jgi:hypothetical protein